MAENNALISGSANTPSTTGGGFFSALTGLITKAADTYVDLQTINAAKNQATGTTPQKTQVNPDAAIVAPFNWKPWAIGGGIALGGLVVLVIVVKSFK